MKKFTFGKALSLTALASAMVLSSCQKEDLMESQFSAPMEDQQFSTSVGQAIEGQYIVVLQDGSINTFGDQSVISQAHIEQNAVKETFKGSVKGFAAKLSPEQLQELRNNPQVAYIEQDRIVTLGKPLTTSSSTKGGGGGNTKTTTTTTTEPTTTTTTTEPTTTTTTTTEPTTTTTTSTSSGTFAAITPLAGETVPWSVERVGYGDGRGKTVWVIDSGVRTDHPDLTVDVSRSKSFLSSTTSIEDGYGHGTSVAGVIAAKNNGSGLIGVAAGATVVALRVFDDAGAGTMSSLISAVTHVDANGKAGDVVNLSLGGGASSTLDNAVKNAAAKGILFAVAAGNSAVDCSNTSPARVNATGVYTVSAMDSYARMWDRSNYGSPVDFSAPGVGITSINKAGTLSSCNGTSFAAPHVAGILLLKGNVMSKGNITGDKDSQPDLIASLN